MSESLISIIVPVYNGKSSIEECVASIAAQTYGNIELIIVNDGSTDGTGAILDELASRYPKLKIIVRHTANEGVSAARNTGIDLATGEYIAFLDADDTYLPDAMDYLLQLIGTDSDIAIAQFDDLHAEERRITPEEAVESTLYQHPGFHEGPWAKLFRRSIFSSGLRFAPNRRYEDMEVCPDLYMQARLIAHSGKKVYNYTSNPHSFINNWSPARLDALWAVDSISSKWGERFPSACRHRSFSANFNIFNLASIYGEQSVAERCWKRIRQMRWAIIIDRQSRIRNRLSAIGSYLGKRFASTAVKILLH